MCACICVYGKRNSIINAKTICLVYEYHPTKGVVFAWIAIVPLDQRHWQAVVKYQGAECERYLIEKPG